MDSGIRLYGLLKWCCLYRPLVPSNTGKKILRHHQRRNKWRDRGRRSFEMKLIMELTYLTSGSYSQQLETSGEPIRI